MDFIADTFKMQIMNRKNKKLSFRTIVCYILIANYRTIQDFFLNYFKENIWNKFFMNLKAKKIMDAKSVVKLSFKQEENNEIFLELLERHQFDFRIVNLNNSDKWYASQIDEPIEISPEVYFILHNIEPGRSFNGNDNSNILRTHTLKKDIYGIVYSYLKSTEELIKFLHANYSKTKVEEDEEGEADEGLSKRKYSTTIYRLTDFSPQGTPLVETKKITISKSFDNIFLDLGIKKNLFSTISNFLNDDYYTLRGIPQNLGILLHGVPGCGKTSLIKALAKYLDRKIIIIDFKIVKKVKHLYALFNEKFKSSDNDNYSVSIKETIFVFEDFDCMSDVFKSRDLKPSEKKKLSDLNDDVNSVKNEFDSSTKEGNGDDSGKGDENKEQKGTSVNEKIEVLKYLEKLENDITLNNILELLDGVIEMEKRIIIMTTNKYDQIDPALIRPGRIDLNLEFKPPSELMIYHIFLFMYQHFPREKLESIIVKYHLEFKDLSLSTSKVINCFMHEDPEEGMLELMELKPVIEDATDFVEEVVERKDIISDINSFSSSIDNVIIPEVIAQLIKKEKIKDYLLDISKTNMYSDYAVYHKNQSVKTFYLGKKYKVTRIVNKDTKIDEKHKFHITIYDQGPGKGNYSFWYKIICIVEEKMLGADYLVYLDKQI